MRKNALNNNTIVIVAVTVAVLVLCVAAWWRVRSGRSGRSGRSERSGGQREGFSSSSCTPTFKYDDAVVLYPEECFKGKPVRLSISSNINNTPMKIRSFEIRRGARLVFNILTDVKTKKYTRKEFKESMGKFRVFDKDGLSLTKEDTVTVESMPYQRLMNYRDGGKTLKRTKSSDTKACETECNADKKCVGFLYDDSAKVCEFKSSWGMALDRTEAKTHLYLKPTVGFPRVHLLLPGWEARSYDLTNNFKSSAEDCARTCEKNGKECRGFVHYPSKGDCILKKGFHELRKTTSAMTYMLIDESDTEE